MQLVEGQAKCRRDARGDIQRGIFLIVLHPAEHLAGNAGAAGQFTERPAAPFAAAADDARQRPGFRHRQAPRYMPPEVGS
jgi:hypothetical protein